MTIDLLASVQSAALLKTPCLTSLLMHRLLMNFADTEIKNRYRPQSRPAIQQPNYFIKKPQNKSNRKRAEIQGVKKYLSLSAPCYLDGIIQQ